MREWTYKTAHAAAWDAANNQMRVNGRAEWSYEDYCLACRTLARLYPDSGANPWAGLARDCDRCGSWGVDFSHCDEEPCPVRGYDARSL